MDLEIRPEGFLSQLVGQGYTSEYAQRGCGDRRNREFGFESQDLPETPDDVYLELDALLMIGFAIDVLEVGKGRARLTAFGKELLADPP